MLQDAELANKGWGSINIATYFHNSLSTKATNAVLGNVPKQLKSQTELQILGISMSGLNIYNISRDKFF